MVVLTDSDKTYRVSSFPIGLGLTMIPIQVFAISKIKPEINISQVQPNC